MTQGDVTITVVGNVVADPELRFTPNGAAVSNFRIATTPRRYDSQTNQWVDGEAMFIACNIWRQAANNVAETLTKGMRVIVSGRMKQRSYETREGERRIVTEIDVDEVGPSLRYATAQVYRNPRSDGNQQGGNGQGGYQQGGNQGQRAQQQAPAQDPWSSAPTGGMGTQNEEPPF